MTATRRPQRVMNGVQRKRMSTRSIIEKWQKINAKLSGVFGEDSEVKECLLGCTVREVRHLVLDWNCQERV